MKRIAFLSVLVLFAALSCKKDSGVAVIPIKPVNFTVSVSGAEGFVWNENFQLALSTDFGVTRSFATYYCTNSGSQDSPLYSKFPIKVAATSKSQSFFACFPYNSTYTDFESITVSVPETQTFENGDNASRNFLYAPKVTLVNPYDNPNVAFVMQPLYSTLELELSGESTISSITIEPNIVALSGYLTEKWTMNLETGELKSIKASGSKKITVNIPDPVNLASGKVSVPVGISNVEVPTRGYKLTFYTPDNRGYVTTILSDKEGTVFKAGSLTKVSVSGIKADQSFDPIVSPDKADNNVVAHRGGSKEAGLPDNSIAALRYACQAGCYAVECDIACTSDNRVIVCHPASKSRSSLNGVCTFENTYSDICKAYHLSNGETLPLLEDFLDALVAENQYTKLWIECKSIYGTDGSTSTLYDNMSIKAGQLAADIIRARNLQSRCCFCAGRKPVLQGCIAAAQGEWMTSYANSEYTAAQMKSNNFPWANFDLTTAFYKNESQIQEFRNMGIYISVYSADTNEEMIWFAQRKDQFYGIVTNYPKALIKIEREIK